MEISRQASLISVTLPGTTYPIRLAFALIKRISETAGKQTNFCRSYSLKNVEISRQARSSAMASGHKPLLLQQGVPQHALYVAHAANPSRVISARRNRNGRVGSLLRWILGEAKYRSFATAHAHTAGSIRSCFDSMAKEPFHPDRTFAFPKRKFGARERSCHTMVRGLSVSSLRCGKGSRSL